MVGRTVGRFRITAELGRGGMATVWKAEDTLLRREVALKVLSEELAASPPAKRRFLREARSGAQIDHPGVPAIFDYGESDGFVYLAQTLVDGETLSARAARSPMPVDEAVRIVREAALALSHAHRCGVLHRDVSGRNIMIARDGRVFVLDFGLALASGDSRITSSNTVIGTLSYLAPEVAQGREADHRSDVYGLGVVLFEALTGTLPFAGDRAEALIFAVAHAEAPSPRSRRPDVSPELERVLLAAMARDPELRPQSAEGFAAALDEISNARAGGTAGPAFPGTMRTPDLAGPRRVEPSERSAAAARGGATLLAVLPFQIGGSGGQRDEDDSLIASGLAESLGVALARLPDLRVIPPASAHAVEGVDDPRQMATSLGANLLLRGMLRRSGFDMRVSWSLLDPWTGVTVAAGTVEGSDGSPFALEDSLFARVREALGYDAAEAFRPGGGGARDSAAHERYLKALGYLQRRDNEASIDGAIALLQGLLESEGEVAAWQADLGRAYLEKYRLTTGRIWETRAAAACQRALALDPYAPEVLITLGEVHLAAGRHANAIDEFERALANRPDSIDAMLGLARACQADRQLERAETVLRRAIATRPGDWRPYSRLGVLFFSVGRYTEAATPFRRVVELVPDNPRGHQNLGSTLFNLDQLDAALVSLERSVEIHPTPRAIAVLGTIHFYLGRFSEAADAYRRAVALSPSDPLVWGSLGSAYRWIPGQESQANEALDRAIALMKERLERNPHAAESWAWLSAWLANRARRPEAIEAIERALELAPEDMSCMAIAGTVYHYLGDRGRALRWLREAVQRGYGTEVLRRDPELAPLREDPEFLRILAEGSAQCEARAGHPTPREGRHEG